MMKAITILSTYIKILVNITYYIISKAKHSIIKFFEYTWWEKNWTKNKVFEIFHATIFWSLGVLCMCPSECGVLHLTLSRLQCRLISDFVDKVNKSQILDLFFVPSTYKTCE